VWFAPETVSCLREMAEGREAKRDWGEKVMGELQAGFSLNFLRKGGDIYTLQKLMGHADLQVMRRYLAQTTEDLP